MSFARALLAAWLAGVLSVTLYPFWLLRPAPKPFSLGIGPENLADLLLNVAMFVPLGLLWRRSGGRGPGAIPAALLLSLAIEALQTRIVYRSPTVADVLANVLGAAVGLAAGATSPRTTAS